MPGKNNTYTPEFREEAARMVIETSHAIADVAGELGISETSRGTGCGSTGRSVRKTSRRCSCPSGPDSASWNVKSGNSA